MTIAIAIKSLSESQSGSSFVDRGQRLPPLVRASQLAKYCHSTSSYSCTHNLLSKTSQTKVLVLIVQIYSPITWHDSRDRTFQASSALVVHFLDDKIKDIYHQRAILST